MPPRSRISMWYWLAVFCAIIHFIHGFSSIQSIDGSIEEKVVLEPQDAAHIHTPKEALQKFKNQHPFFFPSSLCPHLSISMTVFHVFFHCIIFRFIAKVFLFLHHCCQPGTVPIMPKICSIWMASSKSISPLLPGNSRSLLSDTLEIPGSSVHTAFSRHPGGFERLRSAPYTTQDLLFADHPFLQFRFFTGFFLNGLQNAIGNGPWAVS